MSRKDKCKEILTNLFGPTTAANIDAMAESDAINWSRNKVESFLGKEKAKIFDTI